MDSEGLEGSKHFLDGVLGDETAENTCFSVHDIGGLRNTREEVLAIITNKVSDLGSSCNTLVNHIVHFVSTIHAFSLLLCDLLP